MVSARCSSSFHAGIWMTSFTDLYPVQNYHRVPDAPPGGVPCEQFDRQGGNDGGRRTVLLPGGAE